VPDTVDKAAREALAKRLLSFSHAEETEVLIARSRSALTRFTHESVHQNVGAESTTIRVRAVVDKRCGVATTTVSDEAALREVVERAIRVAGWAPRDDEWPGLPSGGLPDPSPANGFAPETAEATADQRAGIADAIFAVSEKHGLWSAGFVATSAEAITIANSHGRLSSHEGTEAVANVKLNGADATGYGECAGPSLSAIDGDAIASVAAQKAIATAQPRAVEPGSWTVILEPVAFGELLSYLTDHFSAQAVEEGSSFLDWASLGQPQVDRSITMRDDWADRRAPGMPFDYEGTPRARLALFREGRAESIVTDSRWAARLGRPNTGHALPAPNGSGPQPLNVVVDPGTASLESLIGETERGLLISRFWYIRPVDQHQSIVTGMTRDGTFLIEKGKLVGGVQNLRFNQSILAALKRVTLSDTPVRTSGLGYTMVVPAAKIEAFTFSSSTSF
jgi:PmbA protein